MHRSDRILFLTLRIFSATGGIEKLCRIVGKALYEIDPTNTRIFSMYDNQLEADNKYFPASVFKGFGKQKIKSIYFSIQNGIKSKVVILSHINLIPVGFLIKKLSPATQLVLFAHGIEVWKPLSKIKLKMLRHVDVILPVSKYTKNELAKVNKVDQKCVVLNNCIDPFLTNQFEQARKIELQKKYGFKEDDFILLTVTRISSDEKYKGHEMVIRSVGDISKEFSNIRYLIVGKYDTSEKNRLETIINDNNLKHAVAFTGFIPDNELPYYYSVADVFIMPSYGEGFGIAFIEAMFYGLPVIAGNKDGSVDALCNGKLGVLIDPLNIDEITDTLKKVIRDKNKFLPNFSLLMEKFSYQAYKHNLSTVLNNLFTKNQTSE
jgi:glycosyltransferase involved in cell wall biosynthesis